MSSPPLPPAFSVRNDDRSLFVSAALELSFRIPSANVSVMFVSALVTVALLAGLNVGAMACRVTVSL